MKYLVWLLYFPLQLLVGIFCKVTTPIVALFIYKEARTDRVKRIDNQTHTFDREYLIKPFYYWQTFDNAVDEYWWGVFTKESILPFVRNATQEQYDNSAFLRYICRVLWMWRNSAYGFAQYIFGKPTEDILVEKQYGDLVIRIRKSSFQIKGKHKLFGNYYNDINIGWKDHRGIDGLMYAGRIIGLRQKK